MQQTWSTYRITLLLYLGVLILPFSFYYTYNAIQSVTSDATIIRQLSQNGGEMLLFPELTSEEQARRKIAIDQNLKQLASWFSSNNKQEFYVGAKTLQEDFNKLLNTWNTFKDNPQKQTALEAWKTTKSLNFTIEKMLLLKQNKIENIFYINLIAATIFLMLIIYFIRVYIHQQLKKHAIHDHETNLFNKKYFLSQLNKSCAKSNRYKEPLSVLWVSMHMHREISKKTKQNIYSHFGKLMLDALRESDTPSRFSDTASTSLFAVILPHTQKENALVLESRLRESLEKDERMLSNNIKFKIAISEFEQEELPEVFIARSQGALKA